MLQVKKLALEERPAAADDSDSDNKDSPSTLLKKFRRKFDHSMNRVLGMYAITDADEIPVSFLKMMLETSVSTETLCAQQETQVGVNTHLNLLNATLLKCRKEGQLWSYNDTDLDAGIHPLKSGYPTVKVCDKYLKLMQRLLNMWEEKVLFSIEQEKSIKAQLAALNYLPSRFYQFRLAIQICKGVTRGLLSRKGGIAEHPVLVA